MNSTGVKTQLVPNAENVNANGTTIGKMSFLFFSLSFFVNQSGMRC